MSPSSFCSPYVSVFLHVVRPSSGREHFRMRADDWRRMARTADDPGVRRQPRSCPVRRDRSCICRCRRRQCASWSITLDPTSCKPTYCPYGYLSPEFPSARLYFCRVSRTQHARAKTPHSSFARPLAAIGSSAIGSCRGSLPTRKRAQRTIAGN